MEDEDLVDSETDFDVICVVSILPSEYDVRSEVTEFEDDFEPLNMADPKPMCYYVDDRNLYCIFSSYLLVRIGL
jgi:hypothetical protein